MGCKAFIVVVLLCIHQIGNTTMWLLPDANKRLDEVTFLAAHNAYANYTDGWRYAQQRLTINQQLIHGVRAFLLDIHLHNGTIVLSHGGTRGLYGLQKSGPYHLLASALTAIQQFIETHPYEIITIFLENFVDSDRLTHEIESIHEFHKLLLTHTDWDPTQHTYQWPTLKWMQEHNKRIIIFNEDKSRSRTVSSDNPFYSVWHHVIESKYGTTNLKHACKQRPESQKLNHHTRSLSLLNFFGTISFAKSKRKNSYHMLKKFIDNAQQLTLGKKPTWIALDFIDQGNALQLINELNSLG